MTTKTLKELMARALLEAELGAFAPSALAPDPSADPVVTPTTTAAPQATADAPSDDHVAAERVVFDTAVAIAAGLIEFLGTCEGDQYQAICQKAQELSDALSAHMGSYNQGPGGVPTSAQPFNVVKPSAPVATSVTAVVGESAGGDHPLIQDGYFLLADALDRDLTVVSMGVYKYSGAPITGAEMIARDPSVYSWQCDQPDCGNGDGVDYIFAFAGTENEHAISLEPDNHVSVCIL